MFHRDDTQLSGVLSPKPSAACDPFSFDDATGKPIAPCGALADTMFNGKSKVYTLRWNIHYGLK